jgi:error-prone DNA polymerase
MDAYAELHCISNFTFLRGASHPEELISQADKLGYEALAITDECSVAGVVRAYATIKKLNLAIKLIVGAEFRIVDTLNVVLLCPCRRAYSEMCGLITKTRRRCEKGQYLLLTEDLTTLTHCLLLWLPQGDETQDMLTGQWLKDNVKLDSWISAERLLENNEQRYLALCAKLGSTLGFELVCSSDVHMHQQNRQPLQDVLTAMRLGTRVDKAGFSLYANAERYLRPLAKLGKLYSEKHINQALKIARRCTFDLSEISYQYPAEIVPQGRTATSYLRELVEAGIKTRFGDNLTPAVRAIIEKELKLVAEQDYEYFFLTIYDLVKFAKSRRILYQGRGSAANSVVCYCLEITSVDPNKINVLFERFISKERNEPPDIDVDFEHERREEVIQYIYQKYGRDRAAIAAAVHTFKLKGALREVGKVLGISETQLEFFIKNINRRDNSQSWQEQVALMGLDQRSGTGAWFVQLVDEIRGFPRHLSQHVGGFVIAKGPLHELVPIENAAMKDRTVIQWDKNDIATLKLLKVDILALGMLSAIRKSFALVQQHYQTTLTMAGISALGDDQAVYRMLQKADSVGVFQIESRAQMSMLPRLKPRCFYDLVIQIAIVRPGPIQGDMVHPYLRRRSGIEAVSYPSEAVKEVLSRTLGVPIFQEQVIKLAMVAAGFTGGEANELRRAMARWKKNGEMEMFRHKLVNGMQQRGYNTDFAERIFKQICGFGEYGFPESHSASFALLAYVSAWLKYYYPAAFYCALLNSLPMGFYSASQLIQDAKRHHINVLPVAINDSDNDHLLVADSLPSLNKEQNQKTKQLTIRLGFRLVKGLSDNGVELILQHRPKTGFKHLKAVQMIGLNQGDLSALASAGVLEVLAGNRFQTRWQMMSSECTLPLFANLVDEQPHDLAITPSAMDDLTEDYQSVGLTLGKHPVALLREAERDRALKNHGYNQLARCVRAKDLGQRRHKSMVSIIGVVTGKQSPGTASGVTFVTLEDDTGNINVVVWKGTAQSQKQAFLTATLLKVNGIVEREGDVIHVIAGKLTNLTHLLADFKGKSRDFR